MKRLSLVAGAMMLFAALVSAADVTGKWTGTFNFNGNNVPMTFEFKADGDTLTGVVKGLPTPNAEIKQGKVKEDGVSFSVAIDFQGNPVTLNCTGKIAEGQIDMTMGTPDGSWSVNFPVKKSES